MKSPKTTARLAGLFCWRCRFGCDRSCCLFRRCLTLTSQWATSWRNISPSAMARMTACTRVATPSFFMARCTVLWAVDS